MPRAKNAIIIGSGIGGLGSACLLAKNGWAVTVCEKNEQLGGRVGQFVDDGFRFDSGPSWFLMPDVYEHFFELLGEDMKDYLKLERLSPSYRVFYKRTGKSLDMFSDIQKDAAAFDRIKPGAGKKLEQYLDRAAQNYLIAKDRFMYKNYDSVGDFLTPEMIIKGQKLNVLSNMHIQIKKQFKNSETQKLLEFAALFLGTAPERTPALYGILNHALFSGVYYPSGGMYKIVDSLVKIAKNNGVQFMINSPVKKIIVKGSQAVGVEMSNGKHLMANAVISNADLHHTETRLLSRQYRTKSTKYWETRTIAPSALLMYIGVKGKLPDLAHHNLFLCKDWRNNFKELFGHYQPPVNPSFYVCCPSKTDSSVAPKGYENLFILIPIAAGLNDTPALRNHITRSVLVKLGAEINVPDLEQRIVYKHLFGAQDFAERYNSYRGSALGLAHTLRQTAAFRPNNINKKVKNLYYVGADTNPGIGIPPALISAELMYKRLINDKTAKPLTFDKLKSNSWNLEG